SSTSPEIWRMSEWLGFGMSHSHHSAAVLRLTFTGQDPHQPHAFPLILCRPASAISYQARHRHMAIKPCEKVCWGCWEKRIKACCRSNGGLLHLLSCSEAIRR